MVAISIRTAYSRLDPSKQLTIALYRYTYAWPVIVIKKGGSFSREVVGPMQLAVMELSPLQFGITLDPSHTYFPWLK